jgi:hypothetical protein
MRANPAEAPREASAASADSIPPRQALLRNIGTQPAPPSSPEKKQLSGPPAHRVCARESVSAAGPRLLQRSRERCSTDDFEKRSKAQMKKMMGLAFVLFGLAATGTAQEIAYNYDSAANFAKYKTYKWVEMPNSLKLDDLSARQLVSALNAGLAAKGLQKVETYTADLYIGYLAAMTQERQIQAYGTPAYGMGPRWGGMASATTSTLTVGSISLDMYDVASKQLVWRGVATKTVEPNIKPEKRQANIKKGVEKLLKNYPPKKK